MAHAEGLLQRVVTSTESWLSVWRTWGEMLCKSAQIIAKKGPLQQRELEAVGEACQKLGAAHLQLGLLITLWMHLWVDHLPDHCNVYRGVEMFSAFAGEERHKRLKSELKQRTFKGGKRQKAKRRSYGDVVRNDNLDWGLRDLGLDVWTQAWTKQRLYETKNGY